MAATLVYQSKLYPKRPSLICENTHIETASKLIDAIFSSKKQKGGVVIVKSNCSVYVPSDGTKKVIRLRHR
jgi:phosphotransferase system IIA component